MYRTATRPAPLDFLLPPTHTSYGGIDRRKDIGLLHLPQQQFTPGYLEAPIRDGLRTPPADDMGSTAYQPQYNSYSSRQDASYADSGYHGSSTSSTRAAHSRTNSALNQLSRASSISNYPSASAQAVYKQQPPSPQPAAKPQAPGPPESEAQRKSANSDMILPNLQIPSSINNSGGSLAEFAAQITCLFWFESTDTLYKAEALNLMSSSPVKRLKDEALPSSGFRKWVVTILSTTQVTQNVILLALLFIYRLKTINPAVKGRSGSEYRLLTVALMLGNKFLDDNTYTNKTWAEVSGISVTEIHVMEVEFLSNMRYSLLASAEQWKEWQDKLGKYWTYCDIASRAPLPLPSPISLSNHHTTIPSPPTSMQASPPSLPSTYLPVSQAYSYNSQYHGAPLSSPLPTMPDHELRPRKRSYIEDAEEPAAKRITRATTVVPHGAPALYPPTTSAPPIRRDAPRLPVPNLTISTSQPMSNGYNGITSFSQQNAPVLPPLNSRSMSTVYPSTPTWTPQLPVLTPTGPQSHHSQHGLQNGQYGTPSRRQSPHSVQELLTLGSSPISSNFPGHNPGHISPSIFLQQRASPYKPIRHVNTLLYPPPSASMHDYAANIDQMHYQPLGKRNEYRSGVVPDYHAHSYSQWPVLPQPNFHS